MEPTVKLKYIRQSAKKVRFVLNVIRGMQVTKALNKLEYLNKKQGFLSRKELNQGYLIYLQT